MNRQIESVLKELGLNDTEIKCYLGLLRFGTTNASALSKRLGMPRSTARHTLEQLAKKDLAILSRKNGAFFFIPEEPERIMRLFNKEQEQLKKKQERIKSIIPQLQQMMNPQIALPVVQFYEGKYEVKRAYVKVAGALKPKETVFDYFVPLAPQEEAEYHDMFVAFDAVQAEKRFQMKVIAVDTKPAHRIAAADATDTEYKFTQSELLPLNGFAGEIFLSPHEMNAFVVEKGNIFGFTVVHQNIISVYRHLFLLAWQSL